MNTGMHGRTALALFLGCSIMGAIGCKPPASGVKTTASPSPTEIPLIPNGERAHATSAEGTWRFDDGRIILSAATGSVAATADIRITRREDAADFLPGSLYEVQLDGQLNGQLTLSLQVDTDHLGGMNFDELSFYEQEESGHWRMMTSDGIASPSHFVSAPIQASGIFGVKSAPLPNAKPTPNPEQDELLGTWIFPGIPSTSMFYEIGIYENQIFAYYHPYIGSRVSSVISGPTEWVGPNEARCRQSQDFSLRFKASDGRLFVNDDHGGNWSNTWMSKMRSPSDY